MIFGISDCHEENTIGVGRNTRREFFPASVLPLSSSLVPSRSVYLNYPSSPKGSVVLVLTAGCEDFRIHLFYFLGGLLGFARADPFVFLSPPPSCARLARVAKSTDCPENSEEVIEEGADNGYHDGGGGSNAKIGG